MYTSIYDRRFTTHCIKWEWTILISLHFRLLLNLHCGSFRVGYLNRLNLNSSYKKTGLSHHVATISHSFKSKLILFPFRIEIKSTIDSA